MAEKGGYGKRPLWQWILLYIVIGGIIYAVVYFLFFAKSGGYSSNSYNSSPSAPSNNYNQ